MTTRRTRRRNGPYDNMLSPPIIEEVINLTGIAILEKGRPLTSEECKDYINTHNSELGKSLDGKCHDYVRVILGKAKGTIIKYENTTPEEGIDRRTRYFGLVGHEYPDNWVIPSTSPKVAKKKKMKYGEKAFNSREKKVKKQIKEPSSEEEVVNQSISLIIEPEIDALFLKMDEEMNYDELNNLISETKYLISWYYLLSKNSINHPFWKAFYSSYIWNGPFVPFKYSEQDIISSLSCDSSLLEDEILKEKIVALVKRIVHYIKKVEKQSFPIKNDFYFYKMQNKYNLWNPQTFRKKIKI